MQEVRNHTSRLATGIERFVIKQIEKKGLRILAPLFLVFSMVYAFLVLLHKALKKPFAKKMPFPSVCIGNIIAGGTGKTSFVMKICHDLEGDAKICVHSRGFRAQKKTFGVVESSVDGDEAFLMKQSLTKSTVVSGKKRLQALVYAEKTGHDLIIFDDGLQNYQVDYSIKVAMLNARCLFGKNRFLPSGYLRDWPFSLRSADYIVLLGRGDARELENFTRKKVLQLKYVLTNEEEFRGKKVALFYGLGQKDQFVEGVSAVAQEIVLEKRLLDHESMSNKDLLVFANEAKKCGADLLICTKKDKIKIKQWQGVLPIVAVEACLEVLKGKELYVKLLENIREQVKKSRETL